MALLCLERQLQRMLQPIGYGWRRPCPRREWPPGPPVRDLRHLPEPSGVALRHDQGGTDGGEDVSTVAWTQDPLALIGGSKPQPLRNGVLRPILRLGDSVFRPR